MKVHAINRLLVTFMVFMLSVLPTFGCKHRERVKTSIKPPFSFVTANDLFGVDCVDPQHFCIVGLYSSIFNTSDGGTTWSQQKSGTDLNPGDVSFVSPEEGWIAGRTGLILHTTDGGTTWSQQKSGISNHLFAITFVDSQYGWAVGDFGSIVHTSDGGTTWQSQGFGEDRIYNDVCFVDRKHGWIAGEYGLIYHTKDSGKTWVLQECQDIIPVFDETEWETFAPSLYSVCFTDTSNGWITGMDGTIIATGDGGKHWKKIPNPAEPEKVTLYKIQVIGSKGWVVGQKGTYLYSSDAGKTWQQRKSATRTKFWLRDLNFCDTANGIAVGSRGTILQTADGGTTWNMLSGIPLSTKSTSPDKNI